MSAPVGHGGVFVYSSTGAFERVIGSEGDGPGGFSQAKRILVGDADTLFVLDEGLRRLQIVDAEGGFVSAFPVLFPVGSLSRLADGTFLLHHRPGRRTDDDATFERFASDGAVVGSLAMPATEPHDFDYWIASASPRGGFWAASMWEYRIEYRTAAGAITEVIERDAPWFPPGVRWEPDEMVVADPPAPMLRHAWESQAGILWTYAQVPDLEWKAGPLSRGPEWTRATYDVVVEAIDLSTGKVLARSRVDRLISPVCNSDLMYAVLDETPGVLQIEVLKPSLEGL